MRGAKIFPKFRGMLCLKNRLTLLTCLKDLQPSYKDLTLFWCNARKVRFMFATKDPKKTQRSLGIGQLIINNGKAS